MAESSLITSVASSVISSTLNNITTLAWTEISFLKDVHERVQLIGAKLRLIQAYLKDAENKPQRNHLTEIWMHEIRRVAYRAQDVIEKMNHLQRHHNRTRCCTCTFSRYSNIPMYLKTLHEIGEEIVKINEFIPGIIDITNNLSGVNSGESSSIVDQIEDQRDPREAIRISEQDEVVGFEIEMRNIVNELLDPTNTQLSVVSIWGTGGIGKTTLARKVFNHPDVKTKFDISIWITISQRYNILSLQKKIFKILNPNENENLEKMSVEEVREKISIFLKEKKYLIVIDDIWTTESWDDINPHNSNFPEMNKGSRIVLTSRNVPVGKHPEIRTFVHELQLLDDMESWELLMKKAFPPYVILSDLERNKLERLGSHLVKKCKGLPLALVVLGGYLSKHLDYQTWSRMSENVDWNEAGNQINISQILALSYHDLPNYLKPPFLYIAIFPEDEIIKSCDLIRLWIAEGFIPPSQKYTSETVAHMYLDQLYERGLVQVVRKNRTHERISRIKIHDVLRDWGIQRAHKEGFFDVIHSSKQETSSDSYHIALYGDCDEHVTTSMFHIRSFLGFELPTRKVYLHNSSSLRVFRYVVGWWEYDKGPSKLPKYLKHMLLLRYLSLAECDNIYWNGPKKGSGKNIQTLVIVEFWKLRRKKIAGSMYTHMDGVVAALEEMKQIVHLKLFPEGRKVCGDVISILSGHRHLEVLQVMRPIKGLTRIPDASVFPPNLLKFSLHCEELVEDPMPILEKLPKLVVLKLCGFNGKFKSMHCTVGGFPQLKYLLLIGFSDLEEWKVDVGAMPNLHHLKLMECKNLKMFPEELMEHRQLQLLEIGDVPHLYKVDYSRLQNKECKVLLAEDAYDSSLSKWY